MFEKKHYINESKKRSKLLLWLILGEYRYLWLILVLENSINGKRIKKINCTSCEDKVEIKTNHSKIKNDRNVHLFYRLKHAHINFFLGKPIFYVLKFGDYESAVAFYFLMLSTTFHTGHGRKNII